MGPVNALAAPPQETEPATTARVVVAQRPLRRVRFARSPLSPKQRRPAYWGPAPPPTHARLLTPPWPLPCLRSSTPRHIPSHHRMWLPISRLQSASTVGLVEVPTVFSAVNAEAAHTVTAVLLQNAQQVGRGQTSFPISEVDQ